MSEQRIHICDFCSTRAKRVGYGGHNLRGVEVNLKIHEEMWCNEIGYPISFKGELCPACVRALKTALIRAYEEVLDNAKERHAKAAARGAAILKRFG